MQTLFLDVGEIKASTRFANDAAVLVLPYIDQGQVDRLAPVLARRAMADGLLVLVNDSLRLGFVKVANLVFARSQSKYFGYLAQDAFPGEGWLRCGLNTIGKNESWLLSFNDGRFFGNIAVFGLLLRAWARAMYHNCVFFPGYKSHFGDTELSVIALAHSKLVFNPGCMLCEVDYDKDKKGNNPADDALYRERARTGFGGMVVPFEPD